MESTKELRVGLVLYGGVALAVYINGVTTEIWHVLRASRGAKDGEPPLKGTAKVYADLLDHLKASDRADGVRVVVDAVAGTSAGGVNGAALYKAVVEGADASILNATWLDDADIENLAGEPDAAPWYIRFPDFVVQIFPRIRKLRRYIRNKTALKWSWVRNTAYTLLTTDDPQKTPLKGDFFTHIIAESLLKMKTSGTGQPLLPNRGTFDLFLTRTDLHGWPRHLPVSRKYHPADLYERTHAHFIAYHVRPPAGGAPGRNPVIDFDLTYGARTTAGFPIAFAPVNYARVRETFLKAQPGGNTRSEAEFADLYLREHRLRNFDTTRARMVDGGLLDNRPFSYVTEAIEQKPADHEVRRVVAYIEPDPEREVDPPPENDPLIKDLLPNLFRLFRHEPIHADIRRVQNRNETVERIRQYRKANAGAINAHVDRITENMEAGISEPTLEEWRRKANADLRSDPMSGYQGYVGLKLRSSARVLSDVLCRALNLPYGSRQAYALRRLVRLWLNKRPSMNSEAAGRNEDMLDPLAAADAGLADAITANQLRLFQAFDIPFRLRRIRAIVNAIGAEYGKTTNRKALDECKRALSDIVFRYEAALDDPAGDLGEIDRIVNDTAGASIDEVLLALANNPQQIIEQYEDVLQRIYDTLVDRFTELGQNENRRIAEAIVALPEDARRNVARELIAFPYHDVLAYPLTEAAGINDLIMIEILRISPYDARLVGNRSTALKSAELAAFNGFLFRPLREIDLLYGRLNGTERMIEMIVNTGAHDPDSPEMQSLKTDFTLRAMQVILDEAKASASRECEKEIACLTTKLNAERTGLQATS